jgi:regulator of protease activity HflC (stomatin/prohibitin superfamily)
LRPAFDSRLLALVSEPGGVARSIAEAINYQFGFEVSTTWFYQLLQRSLLPLAVFTMLALIALSSVVIVDADQEAIIERFGRPTSSDTVYEPGIHLKQPWPIDRVYRTSVSHLRTVVVGSETGDEKEAKRTEGEQEDPEKQLMLWTEKHEFAPHMMILVADPEGMPLSDGAPAEGRGDSPDPRERAVGVSMVKASLAIQYRTRDLRDYLYNYEAPEAVLEAVAYQALTDYAAGVDIDQIIGPGRKKFEEGLRQYLQERIDGMGLGMGIVFLGLQGCHPPFEDGVAAAFQGVVSAESAKDATIEAARGEAQQIKSQVAGSVERADRLDAAIREMNRLAAGKQAGDDELAAAEQRVEDLLMGNKSDGIDPTSGEAAAQIARAQAARTVAVARARSRQRLFANELRTCQAAPRLYRMRKYLAMWSEVTADIRKYVVVADPEKTELILILEGEKETILDLEEPGESASK